MDQPHLRHDHVEWPAAHSDRYVKAARSYSEHTQATAGGSVAVRAEQRIAGDGEALQVYLVADAVAGPREIDAVFSGNGLQETMVVGVLEAGLEHIVVNVAHGNVGAHTRDAH